VALHDKLENLLSRRAGEIQKILQEYGVPMVYATGQTGAGT
jgi:hypothetical protein